MSLMATISNISRTSLHDGPGIRTVVYFKGCGLHCAWCHNPETLSAETEILYAPTKCIRCGQCVAACPDHHIIQVNTMVFLRDGCQKCGSSTEACPSGAVSLCGKHYSVEDVMAQVRKDLHYYKQSGGGVTLSGGECLLHADFCAELLHHCKEAGIHTCIETALFVPWHNIEKVLPVCDFFYADCKIAAPEKHKQYTGQDNRLILENLQKLADAAGKKVTVRIPLIPSVNDSAEDIQGFVACLQPFAGKLAGIEVLRYNNLAQGKYQQLEKDYTNFSNMQSDETLLAYCCALEESLSHATNVYTVL